jgi:hypothetical protein
MQRIARMHGSMQTCIAMSFMPLTAHHTSAMALQVNTAISYTTVLAMHSLVVHFFRHVATNHCSHQHDLHNLP